MTTLEVFATMWRRSVIVMTLSGAMLASSVARAQQKPTAGGNAPAAGSAQPKNASMQSVSAENYWFEWALVIVMTGAAMIAVCRSSRRNA